MRNVTSWTTTIRLYLCMCGCDLWIKVEKWELVNWVQTGKE